MKSNRVAGDFSPRRKKGDRSIFLTLAADNKKAGKIIHVPFAVSVLPSGFLQTLPHNNALAIGYYFMLSQILNTGSHTGDFKPMSSRPCRAHTS